MGNIPINGLLRHLGTLARTYQSQNLQQDAHGKKRSGKIMQGCYMENKFFMTEIAVFFDEKTAMDLPSMKDGQRCSSEYRFFILENQLHAINPLERVNYENCKGD